LRLISTLDKRKDVYFAEAWITEAEKRYQDYKNGKVKSVDAEDVFSGTFKRLNEQGSIPIAYH